MTRAKEFFKRIVAGLLSFSMVVSLFEGMDLVLPLSSNDADAVATETSGARLFWRYDSNQVGNVISKNQIHVYAFEGETICFGSNVYDSNWDLKGTKTGSGSDYTGNDIVLIDLKGEYNSYDVVENSDGFIKDPATEALIREMTYDDVMTGETITNTTGATYKPFTYQVTQTGVYTFEFRTRIKSGNTTSDDKQDRNMTKDISWKNTLQGEVSSWDITIFDEFGDKKTGRTYCDFIALQTAGPNIIEDYYIVTNDSYIYEMKFNKIGPWTFTFFANNRGIVDNANGNILYKSVKAINNTWTNDYKNTFGVHGFTYKQPSSADTDLSKTFKIFLEQPDPELEGYLYKKARAPETPTNVKFLGTVFNGKEEVTGAYEGVGGYFSFDVKEATTATLRLEFKIGKDGNELKPGEEPYYTPVEISDIVTPNSTNVFYWDGRDGDGKIIPPGEYTPDQIAYSVITKAGEIHFPIFDMEQAPGGITITRTSPIYDAEDNRLDTPGSVYDDTKSVIYYDESDIYYGGKIGITATKTEKDVYDDANPKKSLWNDSYYTNRIIPDSNGNYFSYTNIKNVNYNGTIYSGEKELYEKYFSGKGLRLGDHSHTSNPIYYDTSDLSPAEKEAQKTTIQYLDSKNHPVGMSTGGLTTTDYAIANYWTFTPSTLASEPSTDSKPLEIVAMPGDGDHFNLRGFAFFDEKVNSSNIIDKEKGTCNGIYDPQKQGDHALAGVVFQLFKETKDNKYNSDKTYYIADKSTADNDKGKDNKIPKAITSESEFNSAKTADKTIYELIDEQASSLKGEYFFTGLDYDPENGTRYMLGFVRPDINYELTTATHTNSGTSGGDDNSYILYKRSRTYGIEAQEITVGKNEAAGMVNPKNDLEDPDGIDNHGLTITMADVGYYFDDRTTVTMEKEYKTEKTGDDAIPKYTVFELSYCVDDYNNSAVYGHRVMSATEQFKYSYPYLPKEIDPEFVEGVDKKDVTAYYVSAEYYIYNKTLYKAEFSFDNLNGQYLSNKALSVSYHRIKDIDKDGNFDEKDVAAEGNLTLNSDGVYNFDKLGDKDHGGDTFWTTVTENQKDSTHKDEGYYDVAPFVTTIDRVTNPSEDKMTVTNSSLPGTIEITKVDESTLDGHGEITHDTVYLEGATFRLYKGTKDQVKGYVDASLGSDPTEKEKAQTWLKENQLQSSSTRSNGQLIFTGLQLKEGGEYITYTIRETFAPTGYTFSPEDAYIEVTGKQIDEANGGYKKLVITNYEPTPNLTIRKVIDGRGWVNVTSGGTKYLDKFTFDISISESDITDTSLSDTDKSDFVKHFEEKDEITISADMKHPVGDTSAMQRVTNIPNEYFKGFNENLGKDGAEKLEFPAAGTYKFTIKENDLDTKNPLNATLTKSNVKYEVTLTVNEEEEEPGEKKQSVIISSVERVIEGDGGTELSRTAVRSNVMTFTNTYNIKDVDADTSYSIEKVITGRNWISTDSFDFQLTGNDDATLDAMRKGYIQFPKLLNKFDNETTKGDDGEDIYPDNYNITVTNGDGGSGNSRSVGLGDIKFSHLSLEGDITTPTDQDIVYCFKITEKSDSRLPGFDSYDKTEYYLKADLDSNDLNGRIDKIIFTVYNGNPEVEGSKQVGQCTIVYDEHGKPTEETDHDETSHNFKFTNNYKTTGTFTPTIEKVLEGREWYPDDRFEFTLKLTTTGSAASNVSMPTSNTVTIDNKKSDHKGTFGSVTINKAGIYNFTITEKTNTGDGIKYEEDFNFTVQAEDDNEGHLTFKFYRGKYTSPSDLDKRTPIQYNGENYDGKEGSTLATFKNTYSENGTLTLGINKTLKGRDWVDDDAFTFTVTPDADTKEKYLKGEYNVIDQNEDGTAKVGVKVGDDGVITLTVDNAGSFDIKVLLQFNGNKDNTKNTYTFTVKETKGTDNIIYDGTKYTLTVTTEREINDDTKLPTGKLIVKASYVTEGGSDESKKEIPDGDTAEFSFTNQAYANAELDISKTFTGRDWNDKDTFTVEVTRTDSAGTDRVYISDTTGASTAADDEFKKDDTQSVIFTAVDHKDKTKYFTFLEPGTYTFSVKEQLPVDEDDKPTALSDDITYDQTEYLWTVTVTDDKAGKLIAESKLEKVTNAEGKKLEPKETVDGDTAKFTNTYACRASITVQKTFTGRSETWTYKDTDKGEEYEKNERNDTFYFTVTPYGEATEQAVKDKYITFDRERIELNGKDSKVDDKTYIRSDSLKVLFSNLEFDADHTEYTFTFLVDEVPEYNGYKAIAGVTYDDTQYIVTMTVTQNSDNKKYEVTSAYQKVGGGSVTALEFHNKYEPTKASVKLSLTKQLTGRQWTKDDEFEFIVEPDADNPKDEDYKTVDGKLLNGVLLDKDANPQDNITVTGGTDGGAATRTADFYFQYSKPGTYTYTINEVDGKKGGITYSDKSYELKVVVKDDNINGKLSIESVTIDGEAVSTHTTTSVGENTTMFAAIPDDYDTDELISFENKYSANLNDIDNDDGACWIWIKKTLLGREWNSDSFTFSIEADDDEFTQNAVGKQVLFAKESKLEDGSRTFEDRKTVSVSDKDDGSNKTEEEKSDTSYYRDSLRIQFVNVTFGEENTNTYKFKIYEVIPEEAKANGNVLNGITYDDNVYHVTVKVRDNKYGTLSIDKFTVTDKGGKEVDLTDTYSKADHKGPVTGEKPHKEYQLPFTNTYDANGSWNFAIEKTIEGRPWNEDESFDFELTLTDTSDGKAKDGVVIPDGGTLTVSEGEGGSRSQNFNVKFTEPGSRVYNFTLKENAPADTKGLKYDSAERNIAVTVTDDGKGGLTVSKVTIDGKEVTPTDPTKISFTNTYSVSTAWTPQVKKELIGRDWIEGDSFTFTLTPDTSDTTTKNAVDSGKISSGEKTVFATSAAAVSFGDITITSDGEETREYKFKLTETPKADDGITYSDPYIITLKVTDDRYGKLTAEIISVKTESGENGEFVGDTVTVTNTYSVTEALPENSIKITKEIEGREWLSTDEFKFTISPADDETKAAVNSGDITLPEGELEINSEAHTVGIGAISFNSTGEPTEKYKFTITEETGDIKGLTYAASQTVTVTVTDDFKGTLTFDVDYESLTFTNKYNAAGELAAGKIGVQSILTGRIDDGWLDTDSFDYTIEGADDSTKAAITNKHITFESDNITVNSDTDEHKNGFGAITFSDIEFPTDIDGEELEVEYKFKVSQNKGKIPGITYDEHYYIVTVTLTDDKVGGLEAKVTDVQKADGAVSAASLEEYNVTALPFNNEYNATGTWSPNVNKLLTGRAWNSDTFTFTIAEGEDYGDSVVMPEDTEIVVTESRKDYKFDEITFNKAGTYTFTVSESVPAGENGIKYPDVQTFTVTATDNTDGTLTVTAGDNNTVKFTNEYSAGGNLASGSISVEKILTGREWQDYDEYVFSIAASEHSKETQDAVNEHLITLPGEVTVTKEDLVGDKYIDKFGEIVFSNIEFDTDSLGKTSTKVFSFVMTEAGGDIGGVTYSEEKLYFNIELTDNGDGTLTAALKRGGGFAFTNEYKPKPATLDGFSVEKVLEGRRWLSEDKFYFTLSGADENTKNQLKSEDIVVTDGNTVSADSDNKTVKFGTLVFNNKGEYTFTISEEYGGQTLNGVTYDNSKWTVSVSVTDDLEGQLWAKVTSISKDGEEADSIKFTNTYYAQTEYSIEVEKFIDGRGWNESDSFEFTLEPVSSTVNAIENGRVIMPEDNKLTLDMNNQSGEFLPITFKSNGRSPLNLYSFRVTEKYAGETHDGLSYDTQYYVMVVVVDDLQGELHAVPISYARFINTYSAEGVLDGGKNLGVTKDFTGRPWIDTDSFTFTISGADDKTSEAIKDGLVTLPEDITIGYEDGEAYTKAFSDISFKSDGSGAHSYDYEFIIKEVYDEDTAVASVDYDTAERHIKVHVTDDQMGHLYAEITNESEYSLTFTNTYHADSITWPPVVSKILTGRNWVDKDSYKFTLSLDSEQPYGAKAENVIISEPELTITSDSEAPDDFTRTEQFGEIEFTQPGRYVFTISEQKDTVDLHGIEYSPRQYKVTVEVTDDTVGQLHQSVYNVLYTVDGGKTYSNYGYDTFRFVNHYGATGVWTPVVRKRLVGREWSVHDSFEFKLSLDTDRLPDGVSESDVIITSGNVTITKGEGQSAAYTGSFGDVTFTKPGTYYFTIAELPQRIPDNGIYEATEPYLVAVHVTDEDSDGVLSVQPEIVLDGESVPYTDVNSSTYRFVDIYSASGTWPPIISKSLAGRKWKDTDKFTFEIEAISWSLGDISESGVVLPEPLTVSNPDLDENTVVGRFGDVVFSQPGVYTFAVREKKESIAGIDYDPTEYRITVEVTDNTYGGLNHEVTQTLRNGEPLSDPDRVLIFTNRYTAEGVLPDGSINVEKKIDGREWREGDSFAFNIAPADILTRRAVTAGLITLPFDAKIQYNKGEKHTGSFDDIIFKSNGSESAEYTFVITENDDSELYPWMSFDKTSYTVKVAVKDNLDGTLSAEVTSVTKDGEDAEIVFVNSYSALGAWPPLVHKELTGRPWSRGDRFEFAVSAEKLPDGVSESDITLPKNVMLYAPESGNISSGQFKDVEFTKPGDYQFKLSEISGSISGVEYSTAEYIISLNVVDEGDGTLTPTVSSVTLSGAKDGEGTSDGGYKFINTYAVKTDGLKIAVNKNLIGRERLSTDKFTFMIAPADKLTEDAVSGGIIEMPESVTASVEGENTTAEFGGIVFNSTGDKETTYSFNITEIDTGISGVKYSDKTVNISVRVTDNLNGRITAVVVGAPDIEFTNSYTASGALLGKEHLKAAKSFVGREWLSGDKFEFTIKPADEYTEAAYLNGFIKLPNDLEIGYNEQGVYSSNFDDIEFLSTGNKTEQYKFEISEVYNESDAVYSTIYDTDTKYTVSVTVTDEYDGTLSVKADKPVFDDKAAEVMTFTNTYTAEGVWPPIVGKTLVGRDWTDEDSFIFRLRLADTQPDGTDRTAVKLPPIADIEITSSDLKDGLALKQFDKTIFTQPGLYVFTLDEMRRTPERGVEYSDNFYTITVRAEHDGNAEGQMDVEIESVTLTVGAESVNYGNTEYFAFENVYSASGSWSVDIGKTLTGRQWLDSDKFSFDISVKVPDGVSPDSVKIRDDLYITADGENSDTYSKTFDDAVIFTKAGEYEVTISERKLSDDNGITYDPTAKTVKVTVTDNGDGTLTVVSESNEFTFTNSYNAVGIWPPEVDKTLIGRPWSGGDSFAFNISAVDFPSGAKLDMPENLVITKPLFGGGDTLSGAFTPVEFNVPGRYEFAVTEVTDTHNGIQCDDTVYTIVVYVADDNAGTLVPGVTAVYCDGEQIDTDSTLAFTNTYSAVGVLDSGKIMVEKELVGRQWLDDDKFIFTLTPIENYGDKIQLSGDTAEILGTYKDKYAEFGDITVHEAGRYVFTVKEENTAEGGITYDDTVHTVTLNAEDNGDGTLKLSVEGGNIKFTNTYSAVGVLDSGKIRVEKELIGRQWLDDDKFTFTLTPTEDYGDRIQLSGDTAEILGTYKDKYAEFGDITVNEAGRYTFTVKEENTAEGGITYDDTLHTVILNAEDNGDGTLKLSVEGGDIKFTNTYSAVGVLDSGKIMVEKELVGRQWLDDDKFTFTLTPTEDYGDKIQLSSNTAEILGTYKDKYAEFGDITVNEAGRYVFTVKEENNGKGGITYDDTVHTVTLNAEDNGDGTLKLSVEGGNIKFTNTYSAVGVLDSGKIRVEKELIGRQWLDDDKFTFTLTSTEDYGDKIQLSGDTAEILGTYKDKYAEFGDITVNEAGRYVFTVKEENTAEGGITYDDTVHTVILSAEDNGDGTLKLSVEGGDIKFTNTYSAVGVLDSGKIRVEKELIGRQWLDDDKFTFTLTPNEDYGDRIQLSGDKAEILGTYKDKYAEFGDITVNEAGRYVFTVKEENTAEGGITYDTAEHTVVLNAEDNGDGTLKLSVEGGDIKFTNIYSAIGVLDSGEIRVEKELVGRQWLDDDKFIFTLTPIENYGDKIQLSGDTAEILGTYKDKYAEFGDITVHEAGRYVFTVKEENTAEGGITYDDTVHTVILSAEDNGDGTLKLSVEGGDIKFTNIYSAVGVLDSGKIRVEKELIGRQWLDDDKFIFTLTPNEDYGDRIQLSGDTAEILGTYKDKYAEFGDITVNEAGRYTFTVKEENTAEGGITYDTAEHTVVLNAEDNGDGTLKLSVEGGDIKFTNIYSAVGVLDSGEIRVEKELIGRQWLDDDKFTFTLTPTEDYGDKIKLSGDKAEILGTYKDKYANFGDITVHEAGRYVFTVKEENTAEGGITYDDTVHTVILSAEDNGDGTLKLSVEGGDIKFTNIYTADPTTVVGEVQLPFDVELKGRQWQDGDEFTFTLSPAEDYGERVQLGQTEVTVTGGDSSAHFGDIVFTEPGEYTFYVKQQPGTDSSITYDDSVYEVTVTVTDDLNGSLTANVNGGIMDFVNVYRADEPTPPPSDTTAPEPTPPSSDTTAPEPTPPPSDTTAPEPTAPPSDTTVPEPTPPPSDTTAPEPTAPPSDTTTPEPTAPPSDTTTPEPTPPPSDTTAPEPTPPPSDTTALEPTPPPSDTTAPEPTAPPSDTTTPEPTAPPSDTTAPEPTAPPSDTTAPEGGNPDTGVAPDVRSCVAAAVVTFGSAMALTIRKRRKKK